MTDETVVTDGIWIAVIVEAAVIDEAAVTIEAAVADETIVTDETVVTDEAAVIDEAVVTDEVVTDETVVTDEAAVILACMDYLKHNNYRVRLSAFWGETILNVKLVHSAGIFLASWPSARPLSAKLRVIGLDGCINWLANLINSNK